MAQGVAANVMLIPVKKTRIRDQVQAADITQIMYTDQQLPDTFSHVRRNVVRQQRMCGLIRSILVKKEIG